MRRRQIQISLANDGSFTHLIFHMFESFIKQMIDEKQLKLAGISIEKLLGVNH